MLASSRATRVTLAIAGIACAGIACAGGAVRSAATPAAASASDTARFLSLYERVMGRAAREPGFFGAPSLSTEQRESVAWLAGSWSCRGRVFATPTTPARAGRGVERHRFRLDAPGVLHELGVDTTATDTVAYDTPKLFYDAHAARWVLPVAQMSAWGTMTAGAWEGPRITFAGVVTIMGSPTDLRQTWTRTSDSTYTIYNEEVGPHGTRVPLDDYACSRAARP